MAIKRKFDADAVSAAPALSQRPMKQLRVAPAQFIQAPVYQDSSMNDASFDSCSPSSANLEPSSYPNFDLYPFPTTESMDMDMDSAPQDFKPSSPDSRTSSDASDNNRPVGLLQPRSSFVHNISGCNQIPRLRVACEAGIGGQRTLWTQCDECGAIEMIGA